jgi:hypothetical protein
MKFTKPHLGGLWAPANDAKRFGDHRMALLFLGESYLVFFEFIPSKKAFYYSSQAYELEGNQLLMMSMTPSDDPKDDQMQIIRWDITDDGLLKLEQDGESSVWEPVLVETLAEEGFPVVAIEGYREAYAQNGFGYSVAGYAPVPPNVDAIKKLNKKK